MPYKLPGIEKQTPKNAGTRALIMAGLVKPKKPRKPRPTGLKYRNDEAVIRTAIIKELRKHGYKVWRIEPSFRGKFGVADLIVMHKRGAHAYLEVKSSTGVLSKDQKEFYDLCLACVVQYHVVRSVEEAVDIMRLL
jgi:hypothetical protein